MNPLWTLIACLALIAVCALVAMLFERKDDPLPPPRPDPRDSIRAFRNLMDPKR